MKLLRHITYWTLISVLFVHTIGVSVLYNLYVVDQSTFIELLCENKDKPEMKCNGTCMLSKLNEKEKQDTESNATPISTPLQIHFIPAFNEVKLFDVVLTSISPVYYYQNPYKSPYLGQVFRPPILA